MKKGIVLAVFAVMAALLTFVAGGGAADAANESPGYYLVSEAKSLRNDSDVLMRGYLVERLHSGKYLFNDSTGFVRVELDPESFAPEIDTMVTVADVTNRTFKEYVILRSIVDPMARVEIVGTMRTDGDGRVMEAAAVRRID